MASGLAVVDFDDAAAREHLRSGENGMIVEARDAAAFVHAASLLATNPTLARELGACARKATSALSWEQVTARFEDILDRVRRGQSLEGVLTTPDARALPSRAPRLRPPRIQPA
jgi:glycosyltransferase involved in cell wall biosynthesis